MRRQSERHYGSDGTRRSCPHGAAVTFPVGTVRHVKVGDMDCAECPCYDGIDEKSIDRRENVATMCCYPDFAPNNRMRTMESSTKEQRTKDKEEPKAEPSGTVAEEG